MRLAPDGYREMLLSSATLGLGGMVCVWLAERVSPWFWAAAVPLLALWLFTLAFFRDPERVIPSGHGLFVAPADGRVTEVARLETFEGMHGPVLKISIFLSVFDVHINRAPCGGRVVRTHYTPGEFLDVRHPECGIRNERNTIVIAPDDGLPGPVVVRQIAGLIARRIVCRLASGDHCLRGQRIGLIKFGSRTDLIMPAVEGLEATVKVNDYVYGGRTVVMRYSPVAATSRGVAESPAAAAAAWNSGRAHAARVPD